MDEKLDKRLKRIERKQNYIIDLIRQSFCPTPDLEVKKIIERCDGDNVKAIKIHSKLNKLRYG